MFEQRTHLLIDALIIIISIILTILAVDLRWLEYFSNITNIWLSSFMSGIFFTSVFTTIPATASLVTLSQHHSVWIVSLSGGLGALIGDLFIFNFIKNRLSQDIDYLMNFNYKRRQRLMVIFKKRLFYWLWPLLGALIIASPLPDELGLILLGLSKVKRWLFALLSFILNFLGILCIGSITNIMG